MYSYLHKIFILAKSGCYISVDSNLAGAHEVLGLVDELLMNPVNFHVDDPSLQINVRFD
jgi:hypothetical protein